jgi:hypothetical protein
LEVFLEIIKEEAIETCKKSLEADEKLTRNGRDIGRHYTKKKKKKPNSAAP